MPLLRALIIGSNLTSSSPFVRNISTATRTIIKEHVKKEVSAPTPTCASTVLGNTPANTAQEPGALALNCSIQKTTTDKQRPSKASNNLEIVTPINVAPFFQYLQGYKPNLIKFLTEGFTFGFKIPYTGQRTFRLSKNVTSIHGNEKILYQRIASCKSHCWSFHSTPFSQYSSISFRISAKKVTWGIPVNPSSFLPLGKFHYFQHSPGVLHSPVSVY